MFGDRSKQLIEKMYPNNDRNFDLTLEQFLTGHLAKEEKEELQVIIKQEDQNRSTQIRSTTYDQIQQDKKK